MAAAMNCLEYISGDPVDVQVSFATAGLTVNAKLVDMAGVVVGAEVAMDEDYTNSTIGQTYYSVSFHGVADGRYLMTAVDAADSGNYREVPVSVGDSAAARNYERLAEQAPGTDPVDVVPTPVSGKCRIWTYAYDKEGNEQAGIPFTRTTKKVTGDEYSSSLESQTVESGRTLETGDPAPSVGYVYFLVRNSGARTHRIKREGGGDVTFTVPDGTTSYQLPFTLGADAE
jgi:hypothetical protein